MTAILFTLFAIVITVSIYIGARTVNHYHPAPYTTPVFISTVLIIAIFSSLGIPYANYELASDIMTYPLSTATIALAVPIYKYRHILTENKLSIGAGLLVGTFATILSAILLGKVFQLTEQMVASLSVKSATVPIAVEIAEIINGEPALAAVFVILTGIMGAMFGPWILTKVKVTNPVSRGLAIGTIAHGIGTAEISREGPLQEAVSGMSMGIAAIVTALIVPWFF